MEQNNWTMKWSSTIFKCINDFKWNYYEKQCNVECGMLTMIQCQSFSTLQHQSTPHNSFTLYWILILTILPAVYSNLSSASESKSCTSCPPQFMGSLMTLEDPRTLLSNGERLAHLSLWANNFSIRPSIRFFSSGFALKIHSRGSKSQVSMLDHTDLTSIMVASQRPLCNHTSGGNYM